LPLKQLCKDRFGFSETVWIRSLSSEQFICVVLVQICPFRMDAFSNAPYSMPKIALNGIRHLSLLAHADLCEKS
jgi:hypothetical protein